MFACCAMAQVCIQLGGDMMPRAEKYVRSALDFYAQLSEHTSEDEELCRMVQDYIQSK